MSTRIQRQPGKVCGTVPVTNPPLWGIFRNTTRGLFTVPVLYIEVRESVSPAGVREIVRDPIVHMEIDCSQPGYLCSALEYDDCEHGASFLGLSSSGSLTRLDLWVEEMKEVEHKEKAARRRGSTNPVAHENENEI